MKYFRVTVTIAVAALLAFALGSYRTSAMRATIQPTDQQIANARADRDPFGLRVDTPYLSDLLSDGADVGSAVWGIPLTEAEMKALDLDGRSEFGAEVGRLMPYLESLPTFAGAWLDQKHDGSLVLMFTAVDDSITNLVEEKLAGASRGISVTLAQHTWADLAKAADLVDDRMDALSAGLRPVMVAIDTPNNRLRVGVSGLDGSSRSTLQGDLEAMLGVDIEVVADAQGRDTVDEVCGNGHTVRPRSNCWDPLRAGDLIYQFYPNNTSTVCTMGFHLVVPEDATENQFLTAGHCGYHTSPNNRFYHSTSYDGGDAIGHRAATLYESTDHRDILRATIDDPSQMSSRIYGTGSPYYMYQEDDPVVGQTVCASLGHSGHTDCGTIDYTDVHWTSETAGLTVYGAAASGIVVEGGDSGSPVYFQYYDPYARDYSYTPVGIEVHEPDPCCSGATMLFTVVADAMSHWPDDAYIYFAHP